MSPTQIVDDIEAEGQLIIMKNGQIEVDVTLGRPLRSVLLKREREIEAELIARAAR